MSDRPSRAVVGALTVLLTAASGVLLAPPGQAATAAARANVLSAPLGGGGGGGDADGSGSARITLRARRGLVCASLSWRGIQRPSAAHIHRASDGAVVVDLSSAVGDGSACARVSGSVIRAINAGPLGYYVNIHNGTHPGGAIKGSLRH